MEFFSEYKAEVILWTSIIAVCIAGMVRLWMQERREKMAREKTAQG